MDVEEVYAAVGEEGFERLVSAFYRQIPDDDILGPMYRGAEAAAETRLRDFLIFRFGGPPRYIERRGHPQLRMRHVRFAVDRAARDRWMALMDTALDDAGLAPDATATIRAFLAEVATFLINKAESR